MKSVDLAATFLSASMASTALGASCSAPLMHFELPPIMPLPHLDRGVIETSRLVIEDRRREIFRQQLLSSFSKTRTLELMEETRARLGGNFTRTACPDLLAYGRHVRREQAKRILGGIYENVITKW